MSGMTKVSTGHESWVMEAVYHDGTVICLGNASSREDALMALSKRFEFEGEWPPADVSSFGPVTFDKSKLEYVRISITEWYVPTEWWEGGGDVANHRD